MRKTENISRNHQRMVAVKKNSSKDTSKLTPSWNPSTCCRNFMKNSFGIQSMLQKSSNEEATSPPSLALACVLLTWSCPCRYGCVCISDPEAMADLLAWLTPWKPSSWKVCTSTTHQLLFLTESKEHRTRSIGYTSDSICSPLSSAMPSFVTRRTNLNHITFSLLNSSSSSPIVQQLFESLGILWHPLHIIHACMHHQINNQKKSHSPAVVLMWAKDRHCFHKLVQTYSVLEKHPTVALLQNQTMQLCDFLLLLFWVFAPAVNCHTNKKQHISRTSMPKSKAKTTASLFTCSTDSFPFSLRCQTLGTTTCQTQESFQALRVGREREAGMGGGGGSSSSSSSSPARCWREWGGGCCMSLQVFKRLRMLYPYSLGRNSRALLAFHSTRWRLFERPERPEKRVSGTSFSGRFGARKLRKHKMGGTSEESTGERERRREREKRRERKRERILKDNQLPTTSVALCDKGSNALPSPPPP